MKRHAFLLGLLALTASCGQQQDFALVSASLVVPRQLAQQLRKIDVFCFETAANRPRCDEILNTATFGSYSPFGVLRLDFPQQNTAVFEDIPDHGTVWRFSARGYDAGNALIAQGCNNGLFQIQPGRDSQISITLTAY